MLSPDGFKQKPNAAPSIWSFDSGYGSGANHEEEGSRRGAVRYFSYTSTARQLLSILMAYSSTFKRAPRATASSTAWALPSMWDWDSPISNSYVIVLFGYWAETYSILQGDQYRPRRDEAAIEPIVTKLSVFTTKETPSLENDYFLPEISSEGETCLTCEFWRITNPGENALCEECRLPKLIEPSLLVATASKGKEPIGSFEQPGSKISAEPKASNVTRCSACELSALIDPSGPSSCSSCSPTTCQLSPISPASDYRVKRSRAGRNSKLPLSALNRLQGWLDAHQENPYPSADEKKRLAQECGITEKQVTTWFTNARARQLSPLDTYLSSGSEDEGAKESDIASAADTPAYTSGFTFLSDNTQQTGYRRAGSVSGSSAFSGNQNRPQPSRRGKKKNYRRSNQPPQITESSPIQAQPPTPFPNSTAVTEGENGQEMWQCTFCWRPLVPKSWRRHEETQHRPRAQWTCMLYGPRLTYPHRSGSCCPFCMAKDPSEEHFLKNHRVTECAKRPIGERTFYRPDHLRQHVKNFHGAPLIDMAQSRWKRGAEETNAEGWMCGFCGEKLETWSVRETHIAAHFKEGMTIAQWRDRPLPSAQNDSSKKGKGKEDKKEKEHTHSHGLARLSRSFTRRSSRNSKSSHGQPQPSSGFANAFEPLPSTMPMSMDQVTQGFSAPPVLPDINIDPLMGGYGNMIDWNTVPMSEPQYTSAEAQYTTDGLVFDPSMQTSLPGDFDLNNAMAFGNPLDYQGHWHNPTSGV